MHLGNVELLSQVTREQPTKHQETLKFTNMPARQEKKEREGFGVT